LFESGNSKVQDLERYISDDIERYGSRLGELEKKLVGAYRETNASEVLEDEGLFEEEDEEETGALAMYGVHASGICFILISFKGANLPTSLEKITLVYENWGLPPNLACRIFPFPRSSSRERRDRTSQQR